MLPAPRQLTADRGDAGRRLDLVLRRHLNDVALATRTRVQAWIENGLVTVNGRAVRRTATRAALGDVVVVALPAEAARARPSGDEDVGLDILFEDDHLIAINKPAGMVVHPTYKHTAGTAMNALLGLARTWPPNCRPSLVGRLDKLTSGILLAAKTGSVHAALQRAGSAGRMEKDYLALVYGRVKAGTGRIPLGIAHDPADRRRMIASDEGAPSLTLFERIAQARAPRTGLAVLRCRLVTGRTHQIRVHLASRGWPIVGDAVYGEPRWKMIADPVLASALERFDRQALHAWRLGFTHPVSGKPVLIEAPMPADLAGLLEAADICL